MEIESTTPPKEEKQLQVTTEVYDSQQTPWNEIRERIIQIEEEAFPEWEADEDNVLAPDFQHPDNTVILLKSPNGEIIGYSYAEPISHLKPERASEDQETAYVTSTAILPEYQKKGYIKPLLTKLDEQLIKKGFSFIERDAAIMNGYADMLERVYGDRIIAKHDHFNKEIEETQRFMRIKLPKAAPQPVTQSTPPLT